MARRDAGMGSRLARFAGAGLLSMRRGDVDIDVDDPGAHDGAAFDGAARSSVMTHAIDVTSPTPRHKSAPAMMPRR